MRGLLGLVLLAPFAIGLLAPGAAVEPPPGDPVFRFTDPDITESSGLVARDGLVVTVNDSGDGNRIFTVDPATGDTVGVTRWQGDATDIEALAPAGRGEVWVGDIGDNAASRDHVEVARVPFGRGEREVDAPTYQLAYPDGPHDAEALLADPATGRLYLVAKEFIGRLYAAPERLDPDRPNELSEVGQVLGIATDGTFSPDGERLVLRNYGQAAVYTWPELQRVAQVDLPRQQQGEGIAISEDGEVLVGSEGAGAEVLRVDLPVGDAPAAPPPLQETDDGSGRGPVEIERQLWPWALGGVAGLVIVVVLIRSLRPR
ncbi:WD40 repeat domain-containing protein [Nocardioides albidus]|uniref:WD40 repeat domain-containing protein n=1 Tax=Nocardioides albidus TaxID=1517589 RepID=A0A5C4VL83_9ACTN|nr:WD40 repeat domain-containing protein [Nocardioides albidus]TNM36405.1 WD40 repeat domain-containing protein [Nocardioides albidus]